MEKTITEYETAEETEQYIQCEECETRWDSRAVRGKQGVRTVALDAVIETSYSGGRRRWKEEDFGDSMYITGDAARMCATKVHDYCVDHYDALFDNKILPMEVEEPDYYVEENKRTVYMCDLCGDDIGEDPDHTVTVNPRLKRTLSHTVMIQSDVEGAGRSANETSYHYNFGEAISVPRMSRSTTGRMHAEHDEVFDCCKECADRIFGLSIKNKVQENKSVASAFFQGVLNSISGVLRWRPTL